MDHCSQQFPFISVPDGTQQLLSERSLQRDERLDHLGESTARELYWNGEMHSMGLVLPTTVPSQQAGRSETPSTLEQPQTIAKLEPLIACISRLCSRQPYSRVPYKIVEQEMRGRMAESKSLGWSDFGMLMEAAYKENVVEPIRKGRKSKIKFLRLIPQSPRPLPLPQVEYSMAPTMPCITSIASQVGHPIATLANAMDYPLEHRPVVVTMLRLMSVTPGAGVPMVELAKALEHDYPCREGDYYLISRAEEAGIISTGEYSGSWAYLNSPPAHTAPIQMTLPAPPWIPVQNPPLQLTSTMAGASYYAFEHPLITSAILELTGGAWDAKVRLVDLIASLLRSYSGAEGTVLPVLFQAKQNGLTMDATDVTGTIWVWLRSPPHAGFTAWSNHTLTPPPEPVYPMPALIPNAALLGGPGPVTDVLEQPILKDYPLAHREVVSTVLKLTRGIFGEKIRVADLASSLAHYFPTSQGPWYLIFQAQESGILKQETGGTGVTWVSLKHDTTSAVVPPPSQTTTLLTSSPQRVPRSAPIQLPAPILSSQSTTMKATASISASQAPTKKFIVDIIPYGEIGHLANPMRKDVEENSQRKFKPSRAEAQEHDPHISPKAVEKEVDSRTRRGRRPSLGMLVDAAFEWMVVEPGVSPPSTPPHASQSIPTQFSTDMRSEPLNAMDEDQPVPTPSPPPAVRVDTSTSPPPPCFLSVAAKKITTVSCSPRYRAVVASLITLTDGTPRKKVRIDDWMNSLRCDYPGAREEFLLSVTVKAEKDGVVAQGRSKDGVQWAWLNPEENV